ncbi:hypothetical protein ACFLZ2_05850, partial [Candidatus Margulisiibacteriota bacterium]
NSGLAGFSIIDKSFSELGYWSKLREYFRDEKFAAYGALMGTDVERNMSMMHRKIFFNHGFASTENLNLVDFTEVEV